MAGFNLGMPRGNSVQNLRPAGQPDKKYINKEQKGYETIPKAAVKFLASGIYHAIGGAIGGLVEGIAGGAEGGMKVGGPIGMIIGAAVGTGVGSIYSPIKAVIQFGVGGATAFKQEMREMKNINEEFTSKINEKFKEMHLNPLIDTITVDKICEQLIEDIGEEGIISKLDTIDNAKITGNEYFDRDFKNSIDESISNLMTKNMLEKMPEIIDNYATKEAGPGKGKPIGFKCKAEGDYTMEFKKTDGKVTIETTQVSSNRTFTFELGTNDSGKHELKFIPKFNEIQYGEDGPLGPNILYNPESEETDAHSAMKYALKAFTNDETTVTTDAIYPAPPPRDQTIRRWNDTR